MAGRSLTPAGKILKWLVIPAILLVGGFYLLGPRVSGILSGAAASPVKVTPVATAGTSKQKFAAPDVDVRSKRHIDPPDVSITARKKRRHRTHPVAPNPSPSDPTSSSSPERKSAG